MLLIIGGLCAPTTDRTHTKSPNFKQLFQISQLFSGPEFRDDQSFQATISIRPDLSLIDFPDEFKELRSDVNQLKVILDALTTEILPSSSKSSDDLSSLLRTSG